jgi:CopG family transcriptional regulator, nickel-responsive regulator
MANGVSRFSVSVDPVLLDEFDEVISGQGYNRSTAVQIAMRDFLTEHKWKDDEGIVVGALTMIYDHHTGGLTESLNELQHNYYDIISSTTHVHMDHDNCLEILAVKGDASKIKNLSNALSVIRGIKQIKLSLM